MTTTTPLFQIGETITVEVQAKRGRQGDFFKAEGFKNDCHFNLFIYRPDDPPYEWWQQVSSGDKLKVEFTNTSSTQGISGNAKALPFDCQPTLLQRSIRKRERGLIGAFTRVEGYLFADEHEDLKHALKVVKQIDKSIHFQDDLVRKFVLEGLERYRIARLMTSAATKT